MVWWDILCNFTIECLIIISLFSVRFAWIGAAGQRIYTLGWSWFIVVVRLDITIQLEVTGPGIIFLSTWKPNKGFLSFRVINLILGWLIRTGGSRLLYHYYWKYIGRVYLLLNVGYFRFYVLKLISSLHVTLDKCVEDSHFFHKAFKSLKDVFFIICLIEVHWIRTEPKRSCEISGDITSINTIAFQLHRCIR